MGAPLFDESRYHELSAKLEEGGVDVEDVEKRLRAQEIETPSWAYGAQGTRFATFVQPGLPRDVFERFEDAAYVHQLTGICPAVAIHIPWDSVDDFAALSAHASDLGIRIGAVNPNLFQAAEFRLGSVCNPDAWVRERACAHLLDCVEIAAAIGSDALSLWLADGTNYPGQDSFSERRARMLECLQRVYGEVSDQGLDLLVEYKLFEPAFYQTDIADWGSALMVCEELGARAKVLVDLGHHAQGVNIEQIVSLLTARGRLGGFHFNGRRYADDDLIVGTTNPLELFLIYTELSSPDVVRLPRQGIDQSHNIEEKLEAMIESALNLQEAYAKALLVDRVGLRNAQMAGDVLGAHRLLMDAFRIDVRPLCAKVRVDLGAAADPIVAFQTGNYGKRIREARVPGVPGGRR